MSEGFLSRWSRRKQELRQAEESGAAPSEIPPAPQPVPDTSAPAVPEAVAAEASNGSPEAVGSAEPPLTEEEIAALPPIESITAETDIRVFLRQGVPDFLRKAALRRVWVLDPMIRDYVDPAREYAYDWNTPGGVPGSGQLLPSDNVGRLLDEIIPDRDSTPRSVEPWTAVAVEENAASATQPCDALPDGGAERASNQMDPVRISEIGSAESGLPPTEQTPGREGIVRASDLGNRIEASREQGSEAADAGFRRRHGGAVPV